MCRNINVIITEKIATRKLVHILCMMLCFRENNNNSCFITYTNMLNHVDAKFVTPEHYHDMTVA